MMARHGENIRKRADGRWEGRYPVYSEEKEQQVYRSVYGKTYREAKEKLNARKSGLSDQELAIGGRILLAQAAQEWLAEIQDTRKKSTYVKYQFIYDSYLKKELGLMEIHKITDHAVRESLPESLSDSIRKSIYCVLNQILKSASKKYSTPVPRLKNPAAGFRNKPVEVLNRREQAELLSALCSETDSFKMAVLLCLYTGLRLGELCALKWTDIDFENRLMVISRTVQRLYMEGQRTKTILAETDPKSQYSRREIPLCVPALELLIRFRDSQEYIFGGHTPADPRTMQNHFKRIITEAGLEDKNFHILRHTFATNCIEGGADVKSLSELLGHSEVQITLNRYVHPSMDTKRKHMNTLSLFYGQI